MLMQVIIYFIISSFIFLQVLLTNPMLISNFWINYLLHFISLIVKYIQPLVRVLGALGPIFWWRSASGAASEISSPHTKPSPNLYNVTRVHF